MGKEGGRKRTTNVTQDGLLSDRLSQVTPWGSQWLNTRATPSFANILVLQWKESSVLHGCLASLHWERITWKGYRIESGWISVAFNFKGSTHLSAFCTLMYYYDTAYYFMVIFIFTYNYLHKSDEAAAVRWSVLFRKAKLKTRVSLGHGVLCVCVSDCLRGLMTSSWPWFPLTALFHLQM